MASEAQVTHSKLDRHIAQVEQLQAAVTARDVVIAQHEETKGHWEDQITENDALLSQRNIVVEYLQEQVQDLTLELNDANAFIEFLQVPPVPPEILEPPAGNEEEDPEEIEGVFELDSEHEGLEPEAQNSDPSPGSESSVDNLDNF